MYSDRNSQRKDNHRSLLTGYKKFADNDKSIYRNINLAVYYAYLNNVPKTIEHLELFSKGDNYAYWVTLYGMNIAFDKVKTDPEFQKIMRSIETKFWKTHEKIKGTLEEKRLI